MEKTTTKCNTFTPKFLAALFLQILTRDAPLLCLHLTLSAHSAHIIQNVIFV